MNENIELNEIENEETEEMETYQMSTGFAMLIGAGLAIAGERVFKLAKSKYTEFKEKMKSKKISDDEEIEDEDEEA